MQRNESETHMEYNIYCFCEVFPLLKNFLYHLASHRQINAALHELPGEREFWVYTCDAHIENAVLAWCMVFGTDSNETHWKKIFNGYDDARNSFLKYLHDKSNISIDDFQKCWDQMTAFRNDYVAHKAGYAKPVPHFDMACTIVFCFDVWIREQIKPDFIDFPKFIKLFDEYQKSINKTLQALIK